MGRWGMHSHQGVILGTIRLHYSYVQDRGVCLASSNERNLVTDTWQFPYIDNIIHWLAFGQENMIALVVHPTGASLLHGLAWLSEDPSGHLSGSPLRQFLQESWPRFPSWRSLTCVAGNVRDVKGNWCGIDYMNYWIPSAVEKYWASIMTQHASLHGK